MDKFVTKREFNNYKKDLETIFINQNNKDWLLHNDMIDMQNRITKIIIFALIFIVITLTGLIIAIF